MHHQRAGLTLAFAGLLTMAGCGLFDSKKSNSDHHAADTAPKAKRVNLNTASHKDLAALPGLTGADADRIIAGRPYKATADLVKKQVLVQKKFDAIKDLVSVGQKAAK